MTGNIDNFLKLKNNNSENDFLITISQIYLDEPQTQITIFKYILI